MRNCVLFWQGISKSSSYTYHEIYLLIMVRLSVELLLYLGIERDRESVCIEIQE